MVIVLLGLLRLRGDFVHERGLIVRRVAVGGSCVVVGGAVCECVLYACVRVLKPLQSEREGDESCAVLLSRARSSFYRQQPLTTIFEQKTTNKELRWPKKTFSGKMLHLFCVFGSIGEVI